MLPELGKENQIPLIPVHLNSEDSNKQERTCHLVKGEIFTYFTLQHIY